MLTEFRDHRVLTKSVRKLNGWYFQSSNCYLDFVKRGITKNDTEQAKKEEAARCLFKCLERTGACSVAHLWRTIAG